MDGLYWKTMFKWMIWGSHYFRKPPYVLRRFSWFMTFGLATPIIDLTVFCHEKNARHFLWVESNQFRGGPTCPSSATAPSTQWSTTATEWYFHCRPLSMASIPRSSWKQKMYSLSVPCLNHGPPKMSLQISCFWVAPFDFFFWGGTSCGGKRRKSRPVAVRFDVAESGLEVNVPSDWELRWYYLTWPMAKL